MKKYFLKTHNLLFSKKLRFWKLLFISSVVPKKLLPVLLFLKRWLDKPLKYLKDSMDDSLEDLVGNHNVLVVKSLSKNPVPINFLACVIRCEFGVIDSLNSEFLENQRCCLAIFRLFSILNEKWLEWLLLFSIVFKSLSVICVLRTLKVLLTQKPR
jgi:hypothetical protein